MQQVQGANDGPATSEVCAATILDVVPALMRVIRAQMRSRRAELSIVQFRALGYVGRHAGASLSELAEHLGLTPPSTSRLVDGLVARQIVRRELSPADRRAVMLSLTAAGAALLHDTRRRTQIELETFVSRLDPTERAVVIRTLRALQTAFFGEGAPVPSAKPSALIEQQI
jgi:DNA-binding MarR family transcriptional regulator